MCKELLELNRSLEWTYTLLYLKWITNKDLWYSYRELCSMLCSNLDERGIWGRKDTCMSVAESLHHSPETITTLLTGYTPKQNKKFFKKRTLGFSESTPTLLKNGEKGWKWS